MNDINQAARSRQRARLAEGEKPPAPRAALALAKSRTYDSAADAPETLRAYKADFDNFSAWCEAHGFQPLPAEPETVGAYLAAAGLGYALPTLRRRVAAKRPLDTRHPAIRETLRGIARTHGEPPRRSAALATEDIKRLVATCGADLTGLRDRALLLLGFAGALRRSELVGLDLAHLRPAPLGMRLLIARFENRQSGRRRGNWDLPRQHARNLPGSCRARLAKGRGDYRRANLSAGYPMGNDRTETDAP